MVAFALAIPSAALAQSSSPSASQYNPQSEQLGAGGSGGSGGSGGGGGGGAATANHGTSTIAGLPFTGLDVGILAVAAVALLGAGVTLRRLSDPARRSAS